MKGTKGLFRLGAIASSMVLMIALSLMVLAGCKTDDDDPGPSGPKSLAVSGDAAAKTLTLILTGATWTENDVVWNSAIPAYVYDVAGTGDIEDEGSVSYEGAVSNGGKTLTLTVSKRYSNTGTITFTPKASVGTSYLEGYTSIKADDTEVPITGSAVTFTIN